MEAGADPMALPPAFPSEQLSCEPSVVRFLPGEAAPTAHVPCLDRSDLRERTTNIRRPFRADPNPVQGRLVGIEGDERGRGIGLRGLLGIHYDDPGESDVDVGDPTARGREDPSVAVGDRDGERGPLTAVQGEPELAGLEVEVERPGGNSDERPANVGNSGRDPVAEPSAVAVREGAGEVGGGEADRARDPSLEGTVASEAGEGASGGGSGAEDLAEAAVDEETEVVHEGASGGGWRVGPGREREDESASRVHEEGR